VDQVPKIGTIGPRATPKTDALEKVAEAARCSDYVSGLTHNFYRYPARFSPAFSRAVILAFSEHGDTVFDPLGCLGAFWV